MTNLSIGRSIGIKRCGDVSGTITSWSDASQTWLSFTASKKISHPSESASCTGKSGIDVPGREAISAGGWQIGLLKASSA
jgi:hypothetical protein